MKRKLFKNIIIYMSILTLTSCSKPIEQKRQEVDTDKITDTTNKSGYIEEVLELPDDVFYIRDIKEINDGEIILIAEDINFNRVNYMSLDSGDNWNELDVKTKNLPITNESELSTSLLNDGKIITAFTSGKNSSDTGVQFFLTNEDMEFEKFELKLNQETNLVKDMPIKLVELNNGDLIGRINTDTLIQIDKENYSEKYRYKFDSYIKGYSNVDELLIITLEDEMISYNIDTGEKQDKPIEFIDNVKDISGEKNVISSSTQDYLYFCNNSKLFAYDLDNNTSKEIINNAKYINNSSLYINNFIKINKNDYMFSMNSSDGYKDSLVRYKYTDYFQSIENEEITIYSLLENKELQGLITQLNMNNSNISIDYKVGLTEGTGVEISDAIKLLNTEIMAGKGPDILILDNLPVDSYIENGVLADIKDTVISNEDSIFQFIIEAFEEGGEICQFPLSISLPVLIGNKDSLNKVNDLNSILDVIKESSIESDNRIFEYLGSPEEFINSFYFIFENNFIDKNNKINKKELTNFLEICDDIYRISKEKDDIYQEQVYENIMKQMQTDELSESKINSDSFKEMRENDGYLPSVNINGILNKNKPLFAYGNMNTAYQFENLYNIMLKENDISYKILKNNNKNIFHATSKMGINSKSENIDLAKEILEKLINSDIYPGELTTNKEKFMNDITQSFNSEEYEYSSDNNHYLKAIEKDIDENGTPIETPIYFLNDDDINDINKHLNKLDSERKINTVLIKEVSKQFIEIIENNITVKDAVENIINNTEIYLSE